MGLVAVLIAPAIVETTCCGARIAGITSRCSRSRIVRKNPDYDDPEREPVWFNPHRPIELAENFVVFVAKVTEG